MCIIEKIKSAKPHDEFEFTCSHCGKKFKKTKTYLRQNKYRAPKFCSRECQKEWYKENCYTTVKCKECGNEFKIKKYIYNKNKTKHFFCNNSCAAKYNNKKRNRKTKYHEGSLVQRQELLLRNQTTSVRFGQEPQK